MKESKKLGETIELKDEEELDYPIISKDLIVHLLASIGTDFSNKDISFLKGSGSIIGRIFKERWVLNTDSLITSMNIFKKEKERTLILTDDFKRLSFVNSNNYDSEVFVPETEEDYKSITNILLVLGTDVKFDNVGVIRGSVILNNVIFDYPNPNRVIERISYTYINNSTIAVKSCMFKDVVLNSVSIISNPGHLDVERSVIIDSNLINSSTCEAFYISDLLANKCQYEIDTSLMGGSLPIHGATERIKIYNGCTAVNLDCTLPQIKLFSKTLFVNQDFELSTFVYDNLIENIGRQDGILAKFNFTYQDPVILIFARDNFSSYENLKSAVTEALIDSYFETNCGDYDHVIHDAAQNIIETLTRIIYDSYIAHAKIGVNAFRDGPIYN